VSIVSLKAVIRKHPAGHVARYRTGSRPHCWRILSVFIPMFLLGVSTLEAQPAIQFKRLETWTYPLVRLVFKPTCDGVYKPDAGPQVYEVRENGLLVKDATIHCVEDTTCCVSTVLVLDRSSSMGWGEPNGALRTAAHQYINSMEPCDEAAIVSFNHWVTLDVPMTSDKAVLHAAVDMLGSNGRTAAYDAIGAGIGHLAQTAKNRCRGVIVISDVGENSSTTFRTVSSVVNFARTYDTRLYFAYICPLDWTNQPMIDSTRGRCIVNSPLNRGYASFNTIIKDDYKECYIEYVSVCPDGQRREVELLLKDYCGGSVAWRGSYTAPLDSTVFQHAEISIGSAEVLSGREVILPVTLDTPVRQVFAKSDITLRFDTSLLRLIDVVTAGTLLNGRSVSFSILADGASVRFNENLELDTPGGVLFYLRFMASDVPSITAQIELKSWKFGGYCLIPELSHGQVRITKEPRLQCELDMPSSASWNPSSQRYEPHPFDLTVTVINTGTQAAWDTRATLSADWSKVELISPLTPSQHCAPMSIQPGGSGTARWQLRLLEAAGASTLHFSVKITSFNHPAIECSDEIDLDAVRKPALACGITAPDTIFFREQYYQPEEFDIIAHAHNPGEAPALNVRAQLLQDTRFTNKTPADRLVADVLLPGRSSDAVFHVRMHPRETDGYDTVRINIQGDGTDPVWCEHAIWVQRVRMPVLTLDCSVQPDSLTFNDESSEYEPNPFIVTTIAENVGETYAEDCVVMLLGPPRITPRGTNLRPLGTMRIGDRQSTQWELIALPRSVAGWDTLMLQVSGKGGYGKQIVLADCRVPVFIPAVRRPEYTLSCLAQDSVKFINGSYQPDPLTVQVRIANIGSSAGKSLSPRIALPPSMRLAAGESAQKSIPPINAGGSAMAEWRLRVVDGAAEGVYRVCIIVDDSIGTVGDCCTDVFIERAAPPLLSLQCWSVDTLFIDDVIGGYQGNPFDVSLNITNLGAGAAVNVLARIAVTGSGMFLQDAEERDLGVLGPGASRQVRWRVHAAERSLPEDVAFSLTALAVNHPEVQCGVSVFVPALLRPKLAMDCSSMPEDSLLFDWARGRYVRDECTVSFGVTNIGGATARNVATLLMLPTGVTLAPGETAQKTLTPSELKPGQRGTASWSIKAMRSDVDVRKEFFIVARADNAEQAECVDPMYVQGAKKLSVLSFPDYTLARHGEAVDIPIFIDRTVGKDLMEYELHLMYDADVLAITGVSSEGTLTGNGWVGARMTELARGKTVIYDYTTAEPLAAEAGTLVTLRAVGTFVNSNWSALFGETGLAIDTAASALNRGEIEIQTRDGRVIVTDPCLIPLVSTKDAALEQNRPNPFTASTMIGYRIEEDSYVRLSVYDRHGREVRILVDQEQSAGEYSLMFPGDDLPSGLYFYRLYTGGTMRTRTMQLLR